MLTLVLALDLLAMLGADRILKAPYVSTTFGIAGSVIAVLQLALGVQVVAELGALALQNYHRDP